MRTILPSEDRKPPYRRQPANTAEKVGSKWYSKEYLASVWAKRPAKILALVGFVAIAAVLIIVFAAGTESTLFGSTDFSSAPKTGVHVNAGGQVVLDTASGCTPVPPTTGSSAVPAASATTASINSAIANATTTSYTPTTETHGIAGSGLGPNAPQIVVRITYDPSSQDFTGGNTILLSGPIKMKSNLRLEIDSGIKLVANWNATTAEVFDLTNLSNVSLTHGDPCHGGGGMDSRIATPITKGKFIINTEPYGATHRYHAVLLVNTQHWLIEWFHTRQNVLTYTAAVVARAADSSYGIYRYHSNENSPGGYGSNQLVSLDHTYISHIWSYGGTVLRFETDGNANGIHYVEADNIYGDSGNRSLALSPCNALSDHISITGVYGNSIVEGIKLGLGAPTCTTPGKFTTTTVSNGCIIAGNHAEHPDADPPTLTDPWSPALSSSQVVSSNPPAGTDITISNIQYNIPSGMQFTGGLGAPGVAGQCSAVIDQSPWYQ